MPSSRADWCRLAALFLLTLATLGAGLGRASRLTYHEAFVAQAAREMLAGGAGGVLIPTVGGQPWLEKPPLAIWLAALSGWLAGGVDELVARLPSAVAGAFLVLGVGLFAARRFGATVGCLAAAVQATTAWTVMRGRLAEADILLACILTWTLLAFDALRATATATDPDAKGSASTRPAATRWLWCFFVGLGLTALAKGIGFGAVLVGAVVAMTLAWDHDEVLLRRFRFAPGWMLAVGIAGFWPLLAALRHPSALSLWLLHVSDRLATHPEHFTGQTGPIFAIGILTALLPWTPLALGGAWRSLPRALASCGRRGADRLLWAWTIAPLLLLALATVRNAHYAIHALPPCSIWAALALTRLGTRLRAGRWSRAQTQALGWATFVLLGLGYSTGFTWLGPYFDHRGVEWAFYEDAARQLSPNEPVHLLYHVPDDDRLPYQTPFGAFPHDWAVRLFYLNRPADCWFGLEDRAPGNARSFAVIGRARDRDALTRYGQVDTLAQGPSTRADRSYLLYRVTPLAEPTGRPDVSTIAVGNPTTRTR